MTNVPTSSLSWQEVSFALKRELAASKTSHKSMPTSLVPISFQILRSTKGEMKSSRWEAHQFIILFWQEWFKKAWTRTQIEIQRRFSKLGSSLPKIEWWILIRELLTSIRYRLMTRSIHRKLQFGTTMVSASGNILMGSIWIIDSSKTLTRIDLLEPIAQTTRDNPPRMCSLPSHIETNLVVQVTKLLILPMNSFSGRARMLVMQTLFWTWLWSITKKRLCLSRPVETALSSFGCDSIL